MFNLIFFQRKVLDSGKTLDLICGHKSPLTKKLMLMWMITMVQNSRPLGLSFIQFKMHFKGTFWITNSKKTSASGGVAPRPPAGTSPLHPDPDPRHIFRFFDWSGISCLFTENKIFKNVIELCTECSFHSFSCPCNVWDLQLANLQLFCFIFLTAFQPFFY